MGSFALSRMLRYYLHLNCIELMRFLMTALEIVKSLSQCYVTGAGILYGAGVCMCVCVWGCSSVGRASDQHATDTCSIPWCGKGVCSQSQLSVQTPLQCLYTPVCNCMP